MEEKERRGEERRRRLNKASRGEAMGAQMAGEERMRKRNEWRGETEGEEIGTDVCLIAS